MDDKLKKLISESQNSVDEICSTMQKHLNVHKVHQVFDILENYLEQKKLSLLQLVDDNLKDTLVDAHHPPHDEKIDNLQDETYDIADDMIVRSSDEISFFNVNDVNNSASLIINESDHDINSDDMHDTYPIENDEQSSVNCKRVFSLHDDSFTLEIDTRHVTFHNKMLVYNYESEENEEEDVEQIKENEKSNEEKENIKKYKTKKKISLNNSPILTRSKTQKIEKKRYNLRPRV